MARKLRKQIYLEPHQDQRLKRQVRETGLSEAELIRLAIDSQAQSTHPIVLDKEAWQAERRFILTWIAGEPVTGGRKWRREDLYER